jgi:ubiquitin-conjugating enzyme E2 O
VVLGFIIEDNAPNNHKFMLTMFQPTEPKLFFQTVSKEHKLLRNSLPEGICVKGYENRMVKISLTSLATI